MKEPKEGDCTPHYLLAREAPPSRRGRARQANGRRPASPHAQRARPQMPPCPRVRDTSSKRGHSPVHLEVEAYWSLPGACAAVVERPGGWVEHDTPALRVEPMAPVDVLAVHEEAFVETANIIHGGLPRHPEPTIENFNVRDTIVVEILRRGPPADHASQKGVQTSRAAKSAPQRRKPHGGTMDPPVRSQHRRPQ